MRLRALGLTLRASLRMMLLTIDALATRRGDGDRWCAEPDDDDDECESRRGARLE